MSKHGYLFEVDTPDQKIACRRITCKVMQMTRANYTVWPHYCTTRRIPYAYTHPVASRRSSILHETRRKRPNPMCDAQNRSVDMSVRQ